VTLPFSSFSGSTTWLSGLLSSGLVVLFVSMVVVVVAGTVVVAPGTVVVVGGAVVVVEADALSLAGRSLMTGRK